MCHPTTCRTCRKTTWTGCGAHVDEVKQRVPDEQWCTCEPAERTPSGLFGRLLGR